MRNAKAAHRPLSERNPGALKAGIPFRGASPTLLTPPGKFKGELCGHPEPYVTFELALGNFGAHSLFFFFLSKIVHLLMTLRQTIKFLPGLRPSSTGSAGSRQ